MRTYLSRRGRGDKLLPREKTLDLDVGVRDELVTKALHERVPNHLLGVSKPGSQVLSESEPTGGEESVVQRRGDVKSLERGLTM